MRAVLLKSAPRLPAPGTPLILMRPVLPVPAPLVAAAQVVPLLLAPLVLVMLVAAAPVVLVLALWVTVHPDTYELCGLRVRQAQ